MLLKKALIKKTKEKQRGVLKVHFKRDVYRSTFALHFFLVISLLPVVKSSKIKNKIKASSAGQSSKRKKKNVQH